MRTIDGYDQENVAKTLVFYGVDQQGNYLYVKFQRNAEKQSELILLLSLDEGATDFELPEHPNTVIKQHKDGWSARGLTIRVLEKDKRVRITYNGLLRRGTRTKGGENESVDEELEHVRLNFIFIASTKPCLSRSSIGACCINVLRFKYRPCDRAQIDQYGSMMGLIRFQDKTNKELFIRGMRQFYVGELKSSTSRTKISLIGVDEIGNIFYNSSEDQTSDLNVNKIGHVKDPLDNLSFIEMSTLNVADFIKESTPDVLRSYSTFKFIAGKPYILQLTISHPSSKHVFGGYPWSMQTTLMTIIIQLNGVVGIGLLEINDRYDGTCPIELPLSVDSIVEDPLAAPSSDVYNMAYVLDLNNPICKDESIAGSKVAALSQLMSLKSTKYFVPNAFCVTNYAFRHFLGQNKELDAAIWPLQAYHKTYFDQMYPFDFDPERKAETNLKAELLDKIADCFDNATIPAEIRDEINGAMSRLGPSKSSRWAVRTSASYDDLDEIYEPVVNQTFLGLHDYQVVSHVLKCWAHIFSQNNVEYRNKYGLPLDDPVGVCVQLMVEPDAAGCLYSRHPSTGDPREIYIHSVYGIAKSIDDVDPDEIVVRRRGDLQKAELVFHSAKLGAKRQRLTADCTTYDVSAEQAGQLSLSEEAILRIAEIGHEIDQLYGSMRDINWALVDDKIYLLQCRPVLGFVDWTDFELTHELGSGVPADKDLLTFVQAGEIFSSCLTPLTCTTICEALASTTFSSAIRIFDDADCDKSPLFIVNMRVAFNYFNLMARNCEETICKNMIARDYALCGRRIITPEVHDAAKRRNCITGPIDRCKLFGGKMQDFLWGSQVMVDEFEKTIENIFTRHCLSPKKLLRALDRDLGVLNKVSKCYGHVLRSSTWYQVQLLSLLAGDNEVITAQNFADFARLMSYCRNVVTAQLPKLITKVADCRGQYVPPNPDPNMLVQWDRKWGPNGVGPINAFIWAFGHLGPNDLELSSMPYHTMREDIWDVLEFVQPRLGNNRRRERSPTPEEEIIKTTEDGKTIPWRPNEPPGRPIDELVREIKSPITPQARRGIWNILQMAHSTLARREQCKALVSKAVQSVRLLIGREACGLVNDGKLPDMRTIFYFTRWELEEFLQDDQLYQTELLRKAHRRRKLWAELNKKRYPEFFYGMPQPIERDEFGPEVRNGDFKIYGTPVCAGSACRRVVVARSLRDATLLRQWDILVAPMVDVGWSYYFPLLAGIITEQGGILSQGAVIARENSVPCIMGVPNATKIFKTGDAVHMDGSTGRVARVSNSTSFYVQWNRTNSARTPADSTPDPRRKERTHSI